eukprot:4484543-Pleurochrysis_carterae.AAC.2
MQSGCNTALLRADAITRRIRRAHARQSARGWRGYPFTTLPDVTTKLYPIVVADMTVICIQNFWTNKNKDIKEQHIYTNNKRKKGL